MAKGCTNKPVRQTGEYLVAAELSPRGLIATTFTGNIPHYDIISSNEGGEHVLIHVKTAHGLLWQFAKIEQYCAITFDGMRQVIGERKACPVRGLVMTFVKIQETGNDRFYILTWEQFRNLLVEQHKTFVKRHNGVRPKQPKSLHAAISERTLLAYRDKWETIIKNLN